jgi:hypothetical protein
MKTLRPASALALPCALLLWNCSDNQLAGNSTETENNATARVIRVDSILAPSNEPQKVPTVATLRLDASNFDFSRSDSEGRDLSIQGTDGVAIPFQIVFWDRIAELGRLKVRIDTGLLRPGSRFVLHWNQTPAVRSDSAAVWAAIPDSQVLAINSVLVDDFEHGVLQNLLPDSAVWRTGKSTSATISSFGLVTAPAGRSGQVLHLSYTADTTSGQYVLTGTQLAISPRCFRSMDSLVFWVKGTGLFSPALEHISDTSSVKAWRRRVLDTGWQRMSIRPQDFDSALKNISSVVGWSGVRDSVTSLTFLIGGGSDLWIDDIRIYGIGPDDLR